MQLKRNITPNAVKATGTNKITIAFNAEIPPATQIIRWDETVTQSGPREMVQVYKYVQRPWKSHGRETVYVLMAPWWLYGGHVRQVVAKLEIMTL